MTTNWVAFQQRKFIFSHFRRIEVQNRGVGKVEGPAPSRSSGERPCRRRLGLWLHRSGLSVFPLSLYLCEGLRHRIKGPP